MTPVRRWPGAPNDRGFGPARRVASVRLAWGVLLLAAPRPALAVALPAPQRDTAVARRVVRILGVRHLVQALIELFMPNRTVLCLAAAVDAVHALTFAGLATVAARWRRGATLDVATALGFCVSTAATAVTTHRSDEEEGPYR